MVGVIRSSTQVASGCRNAIGTHTRIRARAVKRTGTMMGSHNMLPRRVAALCAVALTLAIPGSRAAKGQFRLGGLFPRFKTQTASFAKDTSGIKRLSGFVLAVHQINNNNTILPNHTIVTSVLDSKRDGGQAFFQALKLVQDHRVEAIVGPASSGPTMAAGLVAALLLPPVALLLVLLS